MTTETETMNETRVITHEGRRGRVSLCERHGDAVTIARHLGADYLGVYHGAHAGVCAECEPEDTYRIEVRDEGRWIPAPGDAEGWTFEAAEAAVEAGILGYDGEPFAEAGVRIVAVGGGR